MPDETVDEAHVTFLALIREIINARVHEINAYSKIDVGYISSRVSSERLKNHQWNHDIRHVNVECG